MRHSRLLVWRKPRNDLWNNTYVFVLHKPGLYGVQAWISICERRWFRACNGKSGHEKSKCRMRNAKGSNCGRAGHLEVCRQREESDGKVGPSSSGAKNIGNVTRIAATATRAVAVDKLDTADLTVLSATKSSSRCGKRGHSSQICQTGQSANANARVVEMESDDPGDEQ